MIPELGHFALILALVLAVVQSSVPLIGSLTGNRTWMAMARPLAWGQLTFIGLSFLCLMQSFLTDDFSVVYVATNSNSLLPFIYKISAIWGAHEGSLLLWVLMLAAWGSAVAALSKNLPLPMIARVISVQGMIALGFLLFMLLTSNPFDRIFPAPLEGRDLNPLLQDPGLAVHPPMLYMGYVGFSVAFAFAIAALIGGKLDAAWARWSRPWTTVAWIFLTIGIALGSWWSYYELGWGGWWFWDPVENASLMPWLLGTALLHSVLVLEKRGALKRWTILLSILTFSFSMLGTFLVRSGVLTSVHAFAVDPARGLFILFILGFYTGSALILYAMRAHHFRSGKLFDPISRESMMLLNNLFLISAAATVLMGTLYPMIMNALNLGQISVGPPYFHYTFVPLMIPLVVLMGAAPFISWKRDELPAIAQRLGTALTVLAFLVTIAWGVSGGKPLGAIFGFAIGAWLFSGTLVWFARRTRLFQHDMVARLKSLPLPYWGMTLAHAGLGLAIIGMVGTGLWMREDLRIMQTGDTIKIGSYDLTFNGIAPVFGSNFTAIEGQFTASRDGGKTFELKPQKRSYPVSKKNTTEAAIRRSFWDDIYIALGQPDMKNGGWVVRSYVHPMVPFLWVGFAMIAFGGLISFAGSFGHRARKG